jgi:hypothetical protein
MPDMRMVRLEDEHSLGEAVRRVVVEFPADLTPDECAMLIMLLKARGPSTITAEE